MPTDINDILRETNIEAGSIERLLTFVDFREKATGKSLTYGALADRTYSELLGCDWYLRSGKNYFPLKVLLYKNHLTISTPTSVTYSKLEALPQKDPLVSEILDLIVKKTS